jgi:hypothetical protein
MKYEDKSFRDPILLSAFLSIGINLGRHISYEYIKIIIYFIVVSFVLACAFIIPIIIYGIIFKKLSFIYIFKSVILPPIRGRYFDIVISFYFTLLGLIVGHYWG